MISILMATAFTVCSFLVHELFLQIPLSLLSGVSLVRLKNHSNRPRRDLFVYGAVIHLLAFYWLPDTLQVFGGFPYPVALVLHLLFAITAALQWLIIGFILHRLRGNRSVLLFPSLYALSDLLFPQLFPWTLANPLISFGSLSSYAEIIGAKGVSFLLLLLSELIIKALETSRRKTEILGSKKVEAWKPSLGVILLLAVGYGLDLQAVNQIADAPYAKVALVQGNIGLFEKRDENELAGNLLIHQQLSSEAKSKGAELVIWPETAVLSWTPSQLKSVADTQFDPRGTLPIRLLYGALTYEGRNENELRKHNGALLIDDSGKVAGHYAKQVLMPFGEFLPLENIFPWLRGISPMTGDFVPGLSSEPLLISIGDKILKPSVLICYEDIVPQLSRAASVLGGNFLVNITNDSWYGDTAAPYQHMLLAQWRTIETARSLVRATNTGVTAFITPRGRVAQTLPNFKSGVLIADIPLIEKMTLYARFGELPFVCLIIVGLGFSVARKTPS